MALDELTQVEAGARYRPLRKVTWLLPPGLVTRRSDDPSGLRILLNGLSSRESDELDVELPRRLDCPGGRTGRSRPYTTTRGGRGAAASAVWSPGGSGRRCEHAVA
jgi:hypothetical protein